jgi:hypothetical protein
MIVFYQWTALKIAWGGSAQTEHYGASYAQFIRYLKLFGISECVGTAGSPYDVLLSIPEVRKFREEQANCKLRKVRKKAVESDVAGPVQSNLQGDGFVDARMRAHGWVCSRSWMKLGRPGIS